MFDFAKVVSSINPNNPNETMPMIKNKLAKLDVCKTFFEISILRM